MNEDNFFWEIRRSPYPSPFLKRTRQFGERSPVYLIDQFAGKCPVLFNAEFLSRGKIDVSMFASALLDSHILDSIDKMVSGISVFDGLKRFIRFVTERKWDYSPIFYYIEHIGKSELSDFLPNAIRRTESLLRLHSMDTGHFLETGEIVPDPEAVALYTSEVGAGTISELAEQRVTSFVRNCNRQAVVGLIETTQIGLIKMVLLHKYEQPRSSPAKKHERFVRFLRNDIGAMLGREAHLALHYFCDRAGKLLGIQSNTKLERALSIVRSTAWDMLLLRLPEILFTESPVEFCIAYVATQEKRLQQLARLATIDRIYGMKLGGSLPAVRYDLSDIPKSVIAEISENGDAQPSIINVADQRSLSVPTGLLNALERELAIFCGNAQPIVPAKRSKRSL